MPPSTFGDCHDTTLIFVTADRHPKLGPQPESTLDVLWVSTVSGDELVPTTVRETAVWFEQTGAFDPDTQHPVHGTMTVDVEAHPEMEVWLGAHGVEHHPILLTHLAQDEERLIGLALVRSGTNALRPARPRFLHAVAQALLDSDDATSTAFAAGTRANTT